MALEKPLHATFAAELGELQSLGIQDIRMRWRHRFKTAPPRLRSKDLLLHAFAYALQTKRHGEMSPRLKRQLVELADNFAKKADFNPDPREALPPGTALVREWNGARHIVIVEEKGFRYEGEIYTSLSAAANAITGAHWNGPKFFKVDRKADR